MCRHTSIPSTPGIITSRIARSNCSVSSIGDRLAAVRGLAHLESFHAEIQPDDVQQARFVVSEKDALLGQRLRPPGRVDRCVIAVSSAESIRSRRPSFRHRVETSADRTRLRARPCWMMCCMAVGPRPARAARLGRSCLTPRRRAARPHGCSPSRGGRRASGRCHSAPWLAVGTVCVGAFMGQLDASIVATALPVIRTNLHASIASVEWVVLIYVLVLAGTVAAVGQDRRPRRPQAALHVRLRHLRRRVGRLRAGAVARSPGRRRGSCRRSAR